MVKLLNANCNGNKKLKNTKDLFFIIWNIPAVVTCPYRTKHCEKFCYALKAEKQYNNVVPQSRKANFEETRKSNFVSNMIYTIETKSSHKSRSNKTCVVRIHESGDFYSKAYAMAWLEIARHFEGNKKIVFMAYTKSLVYFEGEKIPDNFVLRASVWDDTKQEQKDMITINSYPIYTAFKADEMKKAIENGFEKCDCSDCANCGKCWDKKIEKLACEIH